MINISDNSLAKKARRIKKEKKKDCDGEIDALVSYKGQNLYVYPFIRHLWCLQVVEDTKATWTTGWKD